jgi:hypothetical protein
MVRENLPPTDWSKAKLVSLMDIIDVDFFMSMQGNLNNKTFILT